jgi:hypothetical protein
VGQGAIYGGAGCNLWWGRVQSMVGQGAIYERIIILY